MAKFAKWMPVISGAFVVSMMVWAQEPGRDSQQKAAQPFEILGFKITSDYYPMLDRGNPMFTADNPDMPRTDVEARTGQGQVVSRRRGQQERLRSGGKLRSQIKIIGGADHVNLTFKNLSSRKVSSVEWDFAFPRFNDGVMVLRYDVSTNVEIRPGGKKTIKHPLPQGATRCKTVTVQADANDPNGGKVLEAVCGPGVDDPSHLQQETVTIKRIRYADGSHWLAN
ncbi:MAG: hypothetical protein IPM66_17050 [Acidobacteriota bacterium]|nr:MAG: hypothetical protein IPM66_17050 [Acidobacteriota bacterium]